MASEQDIRTQTSVQRPCNSPGDDFRLVVSAFPPSRPEKGNRHYQVYVTEDFRGRNPFSKHMSEEQAGTDILSVFYTVWDFSVVRFGIEEKQGGRKAVRGPERRSLPFVEQTAQ